MLMQTRFFAMVMGLVLSSLAHAETFSRVIQVEAGGLECAARAARVSALIVSNSFVKRLKTVECVNEFEGVASFGPYRVYSISVELDAEASFSMPTAEYGSDVLASEVGSLNGAFPSLDACLRARPAEMASFEENVGVSALFVSCLPDHSSVQEGYVMSIAGFGQPKKSLQVFQFYGAYHSDGLLSVTQIQWLNHELTSRGAAVRLNDGRRVFYYADDSILQGLSVFGGFIQAQQCQSQLSEVQEMLGKASVQASVECQQHETRMSMEVLTVGQTLWHGEVYGQKYSSYEVCMKYKGVVAARERRNDPNHFLGLICSSDYAGGSFVHTKLMAY
ncbi:hypothetical protein EBZ37_05230 [bacterium]|nr:hypothetical protein [bacterium]